jgi:A/G-specific adenine glycosylase
MRRRLLEWYENHRRDLPWRRSGDPYAIWLSEVMLQQTRVETVRPYFRRFLDAFPTLADLAAADLETVLKMWEGLGYYARARNFHKAAGRVVDEHGGRVPDAWEAFRALPGVGDYIAAAVLSIAFNGPYAVVDGNVKRVLARLFRREEPVNRSSAHPVFRRLADRLLEVHRPGDFNQALMELGALVCTPRNPGCDECPLSQECRAARDGVTDRYPRRERKARTPRRRRAAAVVERDGRILVTRRPPEGLLGGLWEFPTAATVDGERPEAALARALWERFGLQASVAAELGTVRHVYTHFRLELTVYRCRFLGGDIAAGADGEAGRWIEPGAAGELPFHRAALKVLSLLENHGDAPNGG